MLFERRADNIEDAVQGGDVIPILHRADGGFRHPVAQDIFGIDQIKPAKVFAFGADTVA